MPGRDLDIGGPPPVEEKVETPVMPEPTTEKEAPAKPKTGGKKK